MINEVIMGKLSGLSSFVDLKPSAIAFGVFYVGAYAAVPAADVNVLFSVGYDLELIIQNTGGVVAILVGLQALGLWSGIGSKYTNWKERREIKKLKNK